MGLRPTWLDELPMVRGRVSLQRRVLLMYEMARRSDTGNAIAFYIATAAVGQNTLLRLPLQPWLLVSTCSLQPGA